MKKVNLFCVLKAFCFTSTLISSVALASFPGENSISVIVPYPPGGGTDVTTRLLSNAITEQTGTRFIVENKPGAAGSVGLAYLARQKSDGYTIAMGQTSNLIVNPILNSQITYDASKDFTPIALVASQPIVIAVGKNSPIKDFNELLNEIKSKKLTMGTPGIGTVSHLAMEFFFQGHNLSVRHIPYPGATQAITEAIGGNVKFVAATLPSAISHIKSGNLRALAVTSKERASMLPDIPTIAEQGYKDFNVVEWKGVIAPAGIGQDVKDRLNKLINTALKNDKIIKAFQQEGSFPIGGSAEDFDKQLKEEKQRWNQVIEKAHLLKS